MRIVVKVGTSTLAYPTGRLNIQRMERLCKTLSDLKNAGHEIILVSSGAIAMGFGKLNLSERPKDMPGKQASAAVGQCELMYVYDKLFTEYNHIVGQLLITAPDIADGGSLIFFKENPELHEPKDKKKKITGTKNPNRPSVRKKIHEKKLAEERKTAARRKAERNFRRSRDI